MNDQIQQLINQERLPQSFVEVISTVYLPISTELNQRFMPGSATAIIGINGCPGSGKSTMALFLKAILESQFGRSVQTLSIDDFYKTKQERIELSETIHPLLITRGVPGTHDIELATHTINNLKVASEHTSVRIPRFNKAQDDRHSSDHWEAVTQSPDFIILEGWCVAATPQQATDLVPPVNALEAELDEDTTWRTYVNSQLTEHYSALFKQLAYLIVLQPPTRDVVLRWRTEQESKLRDALRNTSSDSHEQHDRVGMNDTQLANFVMHYERLIRHMHDTLPNKANTLVELADDRTIINFNIRQ